MSFLSSFLKPLLEDLTVYALIILLFVFYYFAVPDYWFLCSILTVIAWGIFRIFLAGRKKGS